MILRASPDWSKVDDLGDEGQMPALRVGKDE